MALTEERRLSEPVLDSVLRTDRYAVKVLQAAWIGDHAVDGQFAVDEDVRCTCLGAEPTLAAILGEYNTTWSQLVGDPEQRSIRTCLLYTSDAADERLV